MQIVVDQCETRFRMIEDVIHIGGTKHGVDGYPDEACAVNAEQRFDEFNRVVANSRNLLAGLHSARHQIIGEAVSVALDLSEGDTPLTVGDGDAIGEALRRAFQEIADRYAADTAGPGHAAGRRQILHFVSSQCINSGSALPLPLWERVGVRGSDLSIGRDPPPGSHLSMRSDLSHKGRGDRTQMPRSVHELMPDPKNLPGFRGAR